MSEGRDRLIGVREGLVCVGLYYAIVLPMVLLGVERGIGSWDQLQYHIEVIEQFRAEWPAPDLTDYWSATTPLYHLVMTAVSLAIGTGLLGLKLVSSLFGAGLCGLMGLVCARLGGRTGFSWRAVALAAPLCLSLYVITSGGWLVPADMAWLCVLALIYIALDERACPKRLALGGLVLLVLAMTRQLHIWAAALLWASAWMGPAGSDRAGSLFKRIPERVAPTLWAIGVTLPAWIGLAYFFWLWGGPTNKVYQDMYSGLGTSSTAYQLMNIGLFGVAFIGLLWPRIRFAWAHQRRWLVFAVLAGVAAAVVAPTYYATGRFDPPAGRYSGLWNALRKTESLTLIGGRTNLVAVALAALGALWAGAALLSMRLRERVVMLVALSGFCAANTMSMWVWQRYHEPFALLWLGVALSMGGDRLAVPEMPSENPTENRIDRLARGLATAGPALLAAALAGVTVLTILTARVEVRTGRNPLVELGPAAPVPDQNPGPNPH